MRLTTLTLALLLVPSLGLISCAPQAGEEAGGEMEMGMAMDMDALRTAVDEGNARVMEAFANADAEALTALFTEDAILLPDRLGRIEGRAAIGEYWSAGLETPIDLTLTSLRVGGHGDIAYDIGVYSVPGEDGGTETGKYISILRHAADGSWQTASLIWNSDEEQEEM